MKASKIRHFCLVPLRFQFTDEGNTILSLTQHKKDLIISFTGGILFTCQISNFSENTKEIKYSAKIARIPILKKEKQEMVKLCSIGRTLLPLIKKPGESYGILMSMVGTHMNTIAKKVLDFDVNCPNSFSRDLSPMIAAIVEQEIHIFTYVKKDGETNKEGDATKDEEPEYNWEKGDIDISVQDIITVTISYPFIFALSSQSMSYISFPENGNPTILSSNKIKMEKGSCCMSYSPPTYFIYNRNKSYVINPDKNFQTISVALDEPCFEHARAGNDFASASNSMVSVYNFTKEYKPPVASTIKFPGCKHIASFDNKYFIATDDTQFYLVSDCTVAFNKIVEGALDNAIESLKYVNTDTLAALFEQLWQRDYKSQALSMLKYKELYPALFDIVSLFKMVKLPTCVQKIKYLSFSEQTEDQKFVKSLTDNLLAIRNSKVLIDNKSNSLENHQNRNLRVIIDTTLFEIYSYQEDIGNLSSFINECPELSNESIETFFNGSETVSRAMYLAYIGNSKDSLEVFKKLENLSPVVLDQVTRIIINTSSNWDFCKENLKWLFKVSPLHACKVLSSDSISSNQSLDFVSKNESEEISQYYNIVLKGVLDHKDILNRDVLVNGYIQHIFQLLLEINNDSFDRKNVAFCKCVIENASTGVETPIEKIKEELSNDFIDTLRKFPKEIDINNPAFQSNQISSNPRVQVEIYRASGKVEKALRLLWDESQQNNDPNDTSNLNSIVQVLENFCKESADTSDAFQILIKLIKEKLPNEQGMKMQMGILSRNMNMIDVSAALANINEDELVENVADFLEETYRTLVTMRKDAELDAAFAESNEFESEYQKIRLESQAIEIRSDTICPKCKKPLNSMYLLRAPNGNLYHWKCMDAHNNNP